MPPSKKKNNKTIVPTSTQDNKYLDNFFGVVIEKPPSPVTISDSQSNSNLESISRNTNGITTTTSNTPETKPVTNTTTSINYSLTDIKNKIERLSENEIFEIFKIIKNNTEKYSTNKSWILVNLSSLKKSTIKEISNFLYFCETTNQRMELEEHNRDIYREIVAE